MNNFKLRSLYEFYKNFICTKESVCNNKEIVKTKEVFLLLFIINIQGWK